MMPSNNKDSFLHRVKPNGRIYQGEYEVAIDEESLVKYLMDDDHQDDVLTLEQSLKTKKIAANHG